jgi:chlorobactene glucosyltransferase
MLTGFPRQEMGSWGERLLVPFFSWAFLCFTPLWLAYRLRLPALSSAVGQMMLFHRQAYHAIGGHADVGPYPVDDLMLARRIKAAGLRWRVAYITELVTSRMYKGSREAFHGFTKNFFAAFDFRLLPYLFVFIWLAVMFWKPLILLAWSTFGATTQARLEELVLCVGLALSLWLISFFVLRIPPALAFLYPVIILAIEVVAVLSLLLSLRGRLTWKERLLVHPRWKWF